MSLMIENPIFRTTNGALNFAYNFRHGTFNPSALQKMMMPSRIGRGLSGLDGAGQAGMILDQVRSIGQLRAHILCARFETRSVSCDCKRACCSGWKFNPEWLLSTAAIIEAVRTAALQGTVVNYLLRRAIVARYFGLRQSLVEAAKAAGVDRHTASAHNNKVVTYLKIEEKFAHYDIEARLKQAGVVE